MLSSSSLASARACLPVPADKVASPIKKGLRPSLSSSASKRFSGVSTSSVVTAIYNPTSRGRGGLDSCSSIVTAIRDPRPQEETPCTVNEEIDVHLERVKDGFSNALELLITDDSFTDQDREDIVRSKEYAALREFALELERSVVVEEEPEEESIPPTEWYVDPALFLAPAQERPVIGAREEAAWREVIRQSELTIKHMRESGGVDYRRFRHLWQGKRFWQDVGECLEKLRLDCMRMKAKFGVGNQGENEQLPHPETERGPPNPTAKPIDREKIKSLRRRCEDIRKKLVSPMPNSVDSAERLITAPFSPSSKALRDFWKSMEGSEPSAHAPALPSRLTSARASWGQLFPVKTAWRLTALPEASKGAI